MDYKKLLEKAKKEMPKHVYEKERFEIPKVRGHVQGNRTIISNFNQIASALHRPVEHLLKYILKELATPGKMEGSGSVIMGSKIPALRINEKIKQYADDFVFCPECGKPDTEFIKENKLMFIKCLVCGAKHPVKSK
ncbi:MAG: translation initiation factor IF-2 subunit beta, partial [Nanoarchaeota archaeon]|nr:translation initiation factor IF-2 subunit beta [Nanoarchaeota archaeon]